MEKIIVYRFPRLIHAGTAATGEPKVVEIRGSDLDNARLEEIAAEGRAAGKRVAAMFAAL